MRPGALLLVVSGVALYLAGTALGLVLSTFTHHPTTHHPTNTVQTFNDGFATAKQDDCQQGYRPACQWLRETR